MKAFLIILLLITQLQSAKKPTITPYKKIDETTLKLHIFNPENHDVSKKTPCAIFFFGGGWKAGTPKQFYPYCRHLASKGIIAISAEYRVSSRNKTTPKECVMDAKSAIRYIRNHASELGIDPNKIIAGGGSAGGHIAAAAATLTDFNQPGENTSTSCIPNALMLFNPVIDNGPGGYGYERVKLYWKKFSPLHNINKKTPATINFQGTKDHLIPVSAAKKFQFRMKALGITSELHLFKNQKHGFFNEDENYKKITPKMDAFLTKLKYLKKSSQKSRKE